MQIKTFVYGTSSLELCCFLVILINKRIEDCSLKLEVIQQDFETLGFSEELHLRELEAHKDLDTALIQ